MSKHASQSSMYEYCIYERHSSVLFQLWKKNENHSKSSTFIFINKFHCLVGCEIEKALKLKQLIIPLSPSILISTSTLSWVSFRFKFWRTISILYLYNSPAESGQPFLPSGENTELHPTVPSCDNFGKIHQGPLTCPNTVFEAVLGENSISNWTTVPSVTAQMSLSSQKLMLIFRGNGAPELPCFFT